MPNISAANNIGAWQYCYDTLGHLTRQVDAKLQRINFFYDELSRLKGKTYEAGPVSDPANCAVADPGVYAVAFTYDAYDPAGLQWGKGHRTGMSDANSSASWTYNPLGQVTGETRTIDGVPYSMSTTYDAFGRTLSQTYPSNQTYPSGESLTYTYNAMGALYSVSGANPYVTGMQYNVNGQITAMSLGNGVTTLNSYNPFSLRLNSSISAKAPGAPLLNLQYNYDAAGNVTQLTDGTRNETTAYQYDDLGRLTLATATQNGNKVIYSRNWSYDLIGNITNVGNLGAAAPYLMSGSFGGAGMGTDLSGNVSRSRFTAYTTGNVSGGYNGASSYGPFIQGGLGQAADPHLSGRGSFASGPIAQPYEPPTPTVTATNTPTATPPPPGTFVEQGGSVVMEAEHNTGTIAGAGTASGSSWQAVASPAGYVGPSAMQALPNSGVNTALATNGPALTYSILFQTTGTFYVFIRGNGPSANDDSVHVGLDGVAATTNAGAGLTGFSAAGYTWQNAHNSQVTTLTVTTAGVHTFDLWMCKDGVIVDRIWLSTSATAVANGDTSSGPAEGAWGGPTPTNTPTITLTPTITATGTITRTPTITATSTATGGPTPIDGG